MKKLLIVALSALLLLSGCAQPPEPAAPTEAPTAAPTEAPSEAPTAEPTAVPFPTPGATGVLTDGPIFPEPAKYLVISGESDLHYVYNSSGELVRTFRAISGDWIWSGDGFYGERGIAYNTWVATGEPTGCFSCFAGTFITTGWDDANGGYTLCKVFDSEFNELFDAEGSIPMGLLGGILDFGDRFLVLNRNFDFLGGSGEIIYGSDPVWLSRSGEVLGTLDPSPFGEILGVFGQKYLIGFDPKDSEYEGYVDLFGQKVNLCDVSGELVREGVILINEIGASALDDELWLGLLTSVNYFKIGGRYFDSDFNEVEEAPVFDRWAPVEPGSVLSGVARYRSFEFEDIYYDITQVYAGVRSKDGEWLFRIYRPSLVSDHDPDRWW